MKMTLKDLAIVSFTLFVYAACLSASIRCVINY